VGVRNEMIADRDVTLMEDSSVFCGFNYLPDVFGKIGRQGVREVRPAHL
jgi:hypothetical protein